MMDPYDEQSLREEVLYLHSLWHQGPPRQQQQQQQRPPLHLHPPSSSLHGLSNRSQINKKRPRKKIREPEYLKKATDLQSEPEKEWPVNPTSSSSPASFSGWPTASSTSNSKTLLPSPEEQARLAASRAQLKALNATIDFLSSDDYDEDDNQEDMDEDDDDDDDDDDLVEKKDGCKRYRFFLNLFMEDGGLKEYYLKNYSNGEFNCLVCGWTLKKYKDCVALVQHSSSIAKKRRVHRAYAQAICKLLGWEIDKLPQIISDLSAKVNESLNKSSMGTGEAQETIDGETKESSSILVNDEASMSISNSEDIQKAISLDTENIPNNSQDTQDEHQKKESADSGNVQNNGDSVISEEPSSVEASAFEGVAKNDGPGDA